MIKAHVSYLDPRVTVHHNPNCANAKVKGEQSQRHLLINADNLSKELHRFRNDGHPFSTEAGTSDMWLILDFQDQAFESALAGHLKRLLGLRYDLIANCELQVHC